MQRGHTITRSPASSTSNRGVHVPPPIHLLVDETVDGRALPGSLHTTGAMLRKPRLSRWTAQTSPCRRPVTSSTSNRCGLSDSRTGTLWPQAAAS